MDREQLKLAACLLREADAVVIAASNGFDIADGYNQFACDDAFLRMFGDFHRTYGLTSMLQGLAARWPSTGERWAFLRRLIAYGYRDYRPTPVMRALDSLTRKTPRFVVTCNCNGRLERAGFSPEALLETEGSFARLRCTRTCSDETYVVEEVDLDGCQDVPTCPRCGAPLDVAADDRGGVDALEPFRSQHERFRAFLAEHRDENLVVLELGVGQGNRAIKAPLMDWAERASRAGYVVLNRDESLLPNLPAGRTAALRGDLVELLPALAAEVAR